ILGKKAVQFDLIPHQPLRAFLRLRFPLSLLDPPGELFPTGVDPDTRLARGKLDATEARIVERVPGHLNGARRIGIDMSFLPQVAQMVAPGLLQAAEE